jgi:hypothetical protein
MAEKIYPKLPSAPPDGGFERYNRVRDIRNELQVLRDNRNRIYKKYGKALSALHNTTTALSSLAVVESTAGIATSLTVVGLPVGVVLTSLGAASGLMAAVLTPIAKHCGRKKVKHAKKHAILCTGISVLDKKISHVLDDNFINDAEFENIIDEYNNVMRQLEAFNIDKVKADAKAEAKEELTQQLLQGMPSKRETEE